MWRRYSTVYYPPPDDLAVRSTKPPLKLSYLYRQNDQIAEFSEQTYAVFGRKEGKDGYGRLMIFQHIADTGY